jgi:hypothetical protein
VHAKVADHAQRHAEESDPMADAKSSGGLTEKAVACPLFFLLAWTIQYSPSVTRAGETLSATVRELLGV